ncbi:hypothetical protein [Devosia sp. DBB001]|nr:hypothetical protein GHV40_10325 [Devosia sp. D6-9]CDP52984.1 hypothetical protein [Devosia sp. DBB001]
MRALTFNPRRSLTPAIVVAGLVLAGSAAPLGLTTFSVNMAIHVLVLVGIAPALASIVAPRLPSISEPAIAWPACLGAAVVEIVIVWGWHIPSLHGLAARNLGSLLLQQAMFLGAGTGIWLVAMLATGRVAKLIAALCLFLTYTHMTMFGLVIALTPGLIYAPDVCGGMGQTGIDDQHLGGVIMAVLGAPPFLLGSALCLYGAIRPAPQEG